MSTAQAIGEHTVAYEYKGVKYTLSPPDIGDYAAYELSLEEAGWAALKRARALGFVQDYEYKEMVREFLAVLATHQLTYGTIDYIKSTQTLPGAQKMLELALAHNHPEFKRNTLGELAGEKLLTEMVRKNYPAVVEALNKLE